MLKSILLPLTRLFVGRPRTAPPRETEPDPLEGRLGIQDQIDEQTEPATDAMDDGTTPASAVSKRGGARSRNRRKASRGSSLELLTDQEAADELGFSARTLQNWRCSGAGPPFVQVSARCVRYRRSDLEAWIQDRLRKSTSQTAARKLGDGSRDGGSVSRGTTTSPPAKSTRSAKGRARSRRKGQ